MHLPVCFHLGFIIGVQSSPAKNSSPAERAGMAGDGLGWGRLAGMGGDGPGWWGWRGWRGWRGWALLIN